MRSGLQVGQGGLDIIATQAQVAQVSMRLGVFSTGIDGGLEMAPRRVVAFFFKPGPAQHEGSIGRPLPRFRIHH